MLADWALTRGTPSGEQIKKGEHANKDSQSEINKEGERNVWDFKMEI